MSYELTAILNRCTKDDAKFLIETIDSYLNSTDDKGLRELYASWEGDGPMPRVLNHKIETEIRYLGSNDFAYMTRKLRGYEPAGVSVDEIIDDLCKLLKLEISTARTLESRLEIFAGKVIDLQFSKLPDERKREILKGMDFEKHHLQEILDRVIGNKEMLLTVLLPLLKGALGPDIIQALIMSIIVPYIGKEAAEKLLLIIASRLPVTWFNPLLWVAGTGWVILDLLGPASRKTIPLILYLGVLCFRNGETKDFREDFLMTR
ncbi:MULTISPECIES: hypothetical protein [unclassified Desulfovibrio]|uniref:hypothetical protein n=1 Tax=unclassified Desulfovibrio TaxID=2593640 RepID=UPI0013EDDC0A|nr:MULTISPECIES: hypothetical protein [unclassified Desulfovibrio]